MASPLYENLSTATIAGGRAMEQLDHQLGEAIRNCLDPNTEINKKRTVTLKVTVVPTQDRESAMLEFEVNAKFPCDAGGVDSVLIDRSGRKGFVPSQQLDIEKHLLGEEKIDPETGEVVRIGGSR